MMVGDLLASFQYIFLIHFTTINPSIFFPILLEKIHAFYFFILENKLTKMQYDI